MSETGTNDALRPWRAGASVPEEEVTEWQQALAAAGGDEGRAAAHIRVEAREIDAVAVPYRAVRLWSILVRRHLATGAETTPETLAAVRELAEARRHAGIRRPELLPPLYAWLRERWLEIEGEAGANAIVALVDLGHTLRLSGEREAALPLLEAGERRSLETFGERDRRYIEACRRLADGLDALGKEKQAIDHADRAWHLARLAFGETDRLTLDCAATCATIRDSLGQRDKALEIGKSVFYERLNTLGKRHSETLVAMSLHAGRLSAEGHVVQAVSIGEEAHDLFCRLLGPKHPLTLIAISYLAQCRSDTGDYSTARLLRWQCLVGRIEVYGEFHTLVYTARNDFAFALRRNGNNQKALEVYREVFEQKTAYMPDTRSCRLTMHNLGFTLMDVGRFEEARGLLERCFEERIKAHGKNHEDTATSSMVLGLCNVRTGEPEKGVALLENALEWRKNNNGSKHPWTAIAWRNLGECYLALDRRAEAAAAFDQARAIRLERLGRRHVYTVLVSAKLIEACLALSDLERARSLLVEMLDAVQGAIPGGIHWFRVTTSCLELAGSLLRSGVSVSWIAPARVLSRKYLEAMDLSDPDEGAYLLEYFRKFHSAWLSLCLMTPDGVEEVPRVLAAIQGREMAAMMQADLEAREANFPEGDTRQRYLETVRELRRLRVMLRALGDGDGEKAGGRPEDGNGRRLVGRDAEVAERAARERAQLRVETSARYSELMAIYEALRAELARTDENFARAYAMPDMAMASLRRLLEPDAALVMLFSRQAEDGGLVHHACCLTAAGDAAIMPLPHVSSAFYGLHAQGMPAGAEAGRAGFRGGHGLFAARTGKGEVPDTGEPIEVPDAAAPDALSGLMRQALWAPLTSRFPGTRRWHVATHQGLHLLPVHLGAEAAHVCLSYPGLLFFWLLRSTEVPATEAPARRILLHTDGAEGSDKPIPFVEVEAALVRAIWGTERVEVVHGAGTLERLRTVEPATNALILAAHGDEIDGPPRQTVIYLDAVRRLQLETNTVLSAAQRPNTVLVSACVAGRVMEDDSGEPLGLVTAFFLNGGRFVLAPLQPISDFYAPIFMGLFHHAWCDIGNPVAAMRDVRQRIRSGRWPEGFTALVRQAYAPSMERVLAEAWERRADPEHLRTVLAPVIGDWPLPEPRRSQWVFGAKQVFLQQHCDTAEKRAALVRNTLDTMIAQRRTLPAFSEISNCTVAFGA